MKKWDVEESRSVLQDRWISVRSDRCVTARDKVLDPYYVLEYPDWVHLVCFDPKMRVLVTRLYRHGTREISLEIPAGTVEPDELPEEAAQRELLEETGCTGQFVNIGTLTPNSATHRNLLHCFAVYDCKQVQEPSPDETEDIAFEFIEAHELLKKIRTGDFYQALQSAAIFLAFMHEGLLRDAT